MTVTVEEKTRTNSKFKLVGPKEIGYNVKQVDVFLDRARAYFLNSNTADTPITSHDVRTASFEPARGGYNAQAVDAAMDRIEDEFVLREKELLIKADGEKAWMLKIGKTAAVLRGRLHRPDGERFRRPARRNAQSYSIEDVDLLCHELLTYIEDNGELSVDVVRRAVFSPAKGPAGYEESQVDAFLDRVVELMASIDTPADK
ncbi:DivIVA domain-containing protein [Arthrobacter silviterrae]|uniref:DivIVA domain-containing protein n=1 Tax=Arthrobacter silviterrae TaxID=2026658 RepID=A0ABX0DCS0_9MICC|nr:MULTISPECIES: DivIVA domain-containing protein [Arthrobacter]MCU6480300.1 DivIVA domain-containing protein [Arthrobacter sp. A2-55]MDQ0279546.1 DivIVA domain-containing protein [Arthrobacter silviterrae]NGN81977.1 DivIVA domain-containing protein [Arthrobacter silviterrae]